MTCANARAKRNFSTLLLVKSLNPFAVVTRDHSFLSPRDGFCQTTHVTLSVFLCHFSSQYIYSLVSTSKPRYVTLHESVLFHDPELPISDWIKRNASKGTTMKFSRHSDFTLWTLVLCEVMRNGQRTVTPYAPLFATMRRSRTRQSTTFYRNSCSIEKEDRLVRWYNDNKYHGGSTCTCHRSVCHVWLTHEQLFARQTDR